MGWHGRPVVRCPFFGGAFVSKLTRLGWGVLVATGFACGSDAAMKAGGEMLGDAGHALVDAGHALVDAGSPDAHAATEGGALPGQDSGSPRTVLEADCDHAQVTHIPIGSSGAYLETTTHYAVFHGAPPQESGVSALICGYQASYSPPACAGQPGCTAVNPIPTDGCTTTTVTFDAAGSAYVQCGNSSLDHQASGDSTSFGRWSTAKLISG